MMRKVCPKIPLIASYQNLEGFPEEPGRGHLGAELRTLIRCRLPESNSWDTQRQPCTRSCLWTEGD